MVAALNRHRGKIIAWTGHNRRIKTYSAVRRTRACSLVAQTTSAHITARGAQESRGAIAAACMTATGAQRAAPWFNAQRRGTRW